MAGLPFSDSVTPSAAPQRSCIVTRQSLSRDELIRFVESPNGTVVPDLRRNLPGRGVWVTAKASIVKKAIDKGLFARGFRKSVTVPHDLAALIDRSLNALALNSLSMTKKAGQIVTGFRQVDAEIRLKKVVLVIHALEAAQDGLRKLDQAIHAAQTGGSGEIAVKQIWHSSQIDLALGGHNVIHAAAIGGGATRALMLRIKALEKFRA